MRQRIGTTPADANLEYRERLRILRERKIEDTTDKKGFDPYTDGDDYGSVMPPEDFTFEPIANHANGGYYGYEGYSKNFYKLMDSYPIFIDPVDAFANRWMIGMNWYKKGGKGSFNPDYSYDHLKPLIELYGIQSGIGSDSHFGGDYRLGLELGWGGLMEKLRKYREVNPDRADFYDAEETTIRAVQQWMRHTVEAIKRAIDEEPIPALKENLRQMLEVNENIIEGAPRTLREACQWICWFNMASRTYNRDGAGDQLDELLRPYYERDRAAGNLTCDEAKYYVACLLLNDPHYYQVGGLSPEGKDMVTPFSYLCLEAADWLDSSCNITMRVHDGMDMEFLRKGVEYLFKNKNGWPRFSGDRALSEGLLRAIPDMPVATARRRVAVGCHWMSLPGLEYTLNDCVKINTLKVFEVAFQEMMAGDGEKSIAALWEVFEKHLLRAVEATAAGIDFHLHYQVYNQPELMLNLISHGPVEQGLDMAGGGARYYNMCIDGSGIASVSDSFAALQQRVEAEKRLTWEEVAKQLSENFEGERGEYVRKMLETSPRYGGGNTIADGFGKKLSNVFSRMVYSMKEKYPAYTYIPGWFSWSSTIRLGQQVGATPNGRRAREPINHGCNPHPGFRRDGALTAMSNTICDIQPGYGNTAPIQLELDPGMANSPDAVGKIADYILAIFEKGATLLNINIIDANAILEADKDPSKFPDLVVRVTGFTAYFSLLTPEFRKLVVDRILTAG